MIALRKLGKVYDTIIPKIIKSKFTQIRRKTLLNIFPVGLCATDNEKLKRIEAPKVLTHEHLIQQASSVAVNAATQLLTQTVVAILDTAEEYKQALADLMSLLQESKEFLGDQNIQNELSDLIIASRVKVNDFRTQLVQLDTLLNYVEKVVVSTAETSFLAGAEFVSTALSERLYSAKLQVDEVMKKIKLLENEYLSLQKDVIETSENEK